MIKLSIEQISEILFETAAEGLVVVNTSGEIVVANPRIEELFGYSISELEGEKVEILIPKKYHGHHHHHRESYNQNPVKRHMGMGMDLLAERKNGSHFPVEVSLNHFVVNGQMMIMALITDITQRKEAENLVIKAQEGLEHKVEERTLELVKSQRLYKAIAENFPNGTINVFDKNLKYVFVEGKELFRTGIRSDMLLGTSYLEKIAGEIKSEVEERLRQVFEGKNDSFEVVFNGQTYSLSAVGLEGVSGEIDQILVVEQNITQKKEAERKVKDALNKERELNELKSRFVSMASHEFRTPLSAILSSATLISKYPTTDQEPKRDKHVRRIKSSVHNLENILNDFLSLDKLETGSKQVRKELFDFAGLMAQIEDEMQTLIKAGQQLKFDFPQQTIFCDEQIVRNILRNLISNAIKYSPESATIQIRSWLKDGSLCLEVVDQGIGIPKEDQANLFARFFRASNATNIQGTGLGLNIVKRYIELLEGQISFESEHGNGTTFFVRIPID